MKIKFNRVQDNIPFKGHKSASLKIYGFILQLSKTPGLIFESSLYHVLEHAVIAGNTWVAVVVCVCF